MIRKFLSLFFISAAAVAQDQQYNAEKTYYINESIEICQPPTDFVHLPSVRGEPYFLNYREKDSSRTYLTIVIWGRDIPKLEINPSSYFSSEKMCMKGVISYYNGQNQLVIRESSQLFTKWLLISQEYIECRT